MKLTDDSKEFALLLRDLITLLEGDQKALKSMKVILASLVRPLDDGRIASLVQTPAYKNATSAAELFEVLSPCWNEFDSDLLEITIQASGSEPAIARVKEFLKTKDPDTPLVARVPKDTSSSLVQSSPHKSPLENTALPVEQQAVVTQEGNRPYLLLPMVPMGSRTRPTQLNAVFVLVKTDQEQLTITQMHEIKDAACHNFYIPRESLVYVESLKGSITLVFMMSAELVPHFQTWFLLLYDMRSLYNHHVREITIPDEYSLVLPSAQVIELSVIADVCFLTLILR